MYICIYSILVVAYRIIVVAYRYVCSSRRSSRRPSQYRIDWVSFRPPTRTKLRVARWSALGTVVGTRDQDMGSGVESGKHRMGAKDLAGSRHEGGGRRQCKA